MNSRWIHTILVLLYVSSVAIQESYDCDQESVPCGCGYRDVIINSRIISGEEARRHSWSMVVSLRYDCDNNGTLRHCCGGTILSDSYVLTAAYCVISLRNSSLENVQIAGGFHEQSDLSPFSRNVDQIFIHPNYLAGDPTHDIAIVHLSRPLNIETNLLFARTCLPPRLEQQEDVINYPPSGINLTIVGWGRLSTMGRMSDTLQQLNLRSISHNESKCANLIQDNLWQFCAGAHVGGKGPCHGDEGGPIFRWIGDRWEQVGIISYQNNNCASSNNQNVFVRLAPHHKWINLILNQEEKPKPVTYGCEKSVVPCGCGHTNVELTTARIVGGEEAKPYSWSMMVSLRLRPSNEHFCGGTILSDSYILTAAHCVDAGMTPDQILVAAGLYNKSDSNAIIREVDQILIFPNWTRFQNRHDIAILHLSQPLDLVHNSLLARTCVSHIHWPINIKDYPSAGTPLATIGWGRTRMGDSSSSPDNLQQVEVFTIDNNDPICNKSLYDKNIQFCAGLHDGGKDTCQGDSGGPILQWVGDRWEQVGITSFSEGCAIANQPGIYTRLSYYYHWIRSIIIDGNLRPPVTYRCDKEKVSCGCGYQNVELTQSRIVGGEEAVSHSWSFMVSIQHRFSNDHFCGGSIFSDSYIITAAHCVDEGETPDKLQIVAGVHNRSDSNGVIREVDEIYVYPNWSSSSNGYRHDIALLHLSKPLDLTTNPLLTRACIPNVQLPNHIENYPSSGTRLTAIGWGNIKESVFTNNSPDKLHQVEVFTIDNNDSICNKSLYDTNIQFCAAVYEGDKDACQGDSGGPILQWLGDRWEQVGIISSGRGCGVQGNAGVYTRLAYYYNWINSIMINNGTKPREKYLCNKTLTSCGCGHNNVEFTSSRIFGGEEAIPYSWSTVVSIRLRSSNRHFCGGTILSDLHILTAARCIHDDVTPDQLLVAAGIHNKSDSNAVIRQVDQIFIYPNLSSFEDGNDIAILHLSQPLDLDHNSLLTRTCLPRVHWPTHIVDYPTVGTQLAPIGWGRTIMRNSSSSSNNLQQARVIVMDNERLFCRRWIQDSRQQFCATALNRYQGPSYGDSGGPIMEWKENHWEQVGIISQFDLLENNHPSIYTRLAYYTEWIESIINTPSISSTQFPPVIYRCDRRSTCGCSQSDVALSSSRIVGGEDAIEGSWSMVASLRFPDETHQCGGTLVSQSFILTAAHCVSYLSISDEINITVAIGMTNRSDSKQIIHKVDQIYVHQNYSNDSGEYRHDIALLHLKNPIIYNNNPYVTKTCIRRIESPSMINQHPRNGSRLAVIGWGILKQSIFYFPQMLQQVEVYAINNNHTRCLNSIHDPEIQFCAGIYKGGKDSCQGDSGGPIFEWTGNYWEQVGIVSYGYGCAVPGYPGIYTRLSYYYDWINNILQNYGEHLEPSNQITTISSTQPPTITTTTTRSLSNKISISSISKMIVITSFLNLLITLRYLT